MRILGYTFDSNPTDRYRLDNIVSPDQRRRKYSDKQILKIFILLQIFNISYRSSGIFLTNHEEHLRMIRISEIQSFQTLSRRARKFDLHAINREIVFLYSIESIAAVFSFMIHTRKYSTAFRRKYWRNYRDTYGGWSKTTKGWLYGMVDSVRNFSYI